MTPETWDSMIPHFLQNVSPAGRDFLHHATQPAQPTSQFFSIGAGEMEGWTLRFLASLADTPNWENTVSLVNDHHQTIAHLAVLFRYTTLLKQVAQWGIDVDVQDVNGFTALHFAYLCGDLDSVRVLKGYGADEDIQDNLGRRPLDMYTPSTNRGSPSSDHTSSSSQRLTTGEGDWERVSMASSQPGSFSNHETTMGLPASRHQPLHTRGLATSSNVIPASPSPAGGSSFLIGDWEMMKGVSGLSLSDYPTSLERTPLFPRVPSVSVATFQYARSQEQQLEELKKTSNRLNWQYNQDIQSPSSLQEIISKPRRDSPSEGDDRDVQSSLMDPMDAVALGNVRKAVQQFTTDHPHVIEPCIGDLAAMDIIGSNTISGIHGESIYSVFFFSDCSDYPRFTCYECGHVGTKLPRAVRHQRQAHFGHFPFPCKGGADHPAW